MRIIIRWIKTQRIEYLEKLQWNAFNIYLMFSIIYLFIFSTFERKEATKEFLTWAETATKNFWFVTITSFFSCCCLLPYILLLKRTLFQSVLEFVRFWRDNKIRIVHCLIQCIESASWLKMNQPKDSNSEIERLDAKHLWPALFGDAIEWETVKRSCEK